MGRQRPRRPSDLSIQPPVPAGVASLAWCDADAQMMLDKLDELFAAIALVKQSMEIQLRTLATELGFLRDNQ
ncbi:hypothetical protein NDU88_003404 [Pleurodeles waltl]|uniref:Uncharacterized protein n=1 Tax=Pleurodeles waltl TaxID=8319 RepID=A0AAV7KYE6_PLEWA|nr:hypothetical protein NDU88_003404 [Pleurodeles waltl]